MSSRSIAGGLLALLIAVTGPATAETPRSWYGPFAGLHLGSAYADFKNRAPAIAGPNGDAHAVTGGVQLGFNWRRGDMIYGTVADFSLMAIEGNLAGGTFEEDSMASLRFRAGVVVDDTLVFGSLGVAWTETTTTLTGVGSSTEYQPGLMLGGGAERWLSDGVTGRVEAYYIDVPTDSQNVGGTPTADGSQNLILRAGLNLHF